MLAAGLRLLIVGVLYAARRRKVVGTIALSGRSWWSLEVAELVGESSWMSFGGLSDDINARKFELDELRGYRDVRWKD